MAVVFDDILLDVEYSAIARGGPEGLTVRISNPFNGAEQVNVSRHDAIGKWAIEYGEQTESQLNALYAFFHARRYGARPFRFRPPDDRTVTQDGTNTCEGYLGTGNGAQTIFYLVKNYISGTQTYTRRIVKPVNYDTVTKVYKDGVLQSGTYTLDSTIGKITFSVAPANGVIVTWSASAFDVPARFAADAPDTQVDIGTISLVGWPIREVLPSELEIYP